MKCSSTIVLTSLTTSLAGILAASAPSAAAADVTGKISLKGTPKPEVEIPLGDMCGPLATKKHTTRHYVASKDGGLANVFVYLKKDGLKAPPTAPSPTLDQVECMYEPYVVGVVAGQSVKVKNSDPLFHNVHATPRAAGNKEFNFGQTKGQVNDKAFDAPEVLVRVKCDVHQWMFAYVGVLDHPYFSVSDANGAYKITGVPDGKYTLVAYHLKTHGAGSIGETKEVEVKGGEVKQDFTVTVPAAP